MKKIGTLKRRRREEGECAKYKTAIRNFCLECMGYNLNEVKHCSAPKCWLFPLRFGCYPDSEVGRRLKRDGVTLV
jgi:hypothetical protein